MPRLPCTKGFWELHFYRYCIKYLPSIEYACEPWQWKADLKNIYIVDKLLYCRLLYHPFDKMLTSLLNFSTFRHLLVTGCLLMRKNLSLGSSKLCRFLHLEPSVPFCAPFCACTKRKFLFVWCGNSLGTHSFHKMSVPICESVDVCLKLPSWLT